MVLLNDFKAQWRAVETTVLNAIRRVGESGWFILGREIETFEQALASFWGVPCAAGCASGLDAIELSLRALDLTPGDRVLTTPLSAFATTLGIVRAGGVPIFVDVDRHGLLDLELCEQALASHPDVKWLVPVDLYGHALEAPYLARLKELFELKIVQDCAQAVGARSFGQPVGSRADLIATSFYPTKNLGAMGDAGAVLGADINTLSRVKQLRDYGQSAKYEHFEMGLNSRLDEIHAAVLNDAFLPLLDEFTLRRKHLAAEYIKELRNVRLTIIGAPDGSDSVWHLFCVLVEGDRESFRRHMQSNGIQTGIHYPKVIPDQPAMASQEYAVIGDLKVARFIAQQEVTLPIHPFLTAAQVEQVISACNTWKL